MRTFYQIRVLVFAALVAAYPPCPTPGTRTLQSARFIPVVTSSPGTAIKSDSYMTIAITNLYKAQLSLSFGSNAGAPTPIGNPTATILAKGSPTHYTFPTGWAGRIYVGPNLNPYGSKIEGSYTGPPDIDISYVDGYSVPITCTSEGQVVTGCNIDLFKQPGIKCNDQVEGPVCLNSAQNIADGPAPRFFAVCQGAAYTYPNDNGANRSELGSSLISCCIGTSCKAYSRPLHSHISIRKIRRYKEE